MKSTSSVILVLALGAGLTASAQTSSGIGSGSSMSGFTSLLTNVFDLKRPFSADAEISYEGTRRISIHAKVWYQDSNLRIFIDKYALADPSVSPQVAAEVGETIKKLGLSRMVVLWKNPGPTRYVLFPDRRVYHTNDYGELFAFPEEPTEVAYKQVVVGQENVDGQDCRKVELRATEGGETETILTMWKAKWLGDFPVKIQMLDFMTVIFSGLKFASIDASYFEVPKGYRRLDSVVEVADEALGVKPTQQRETKEEVNTRVLQWQKDLADQGSSYGEYSMGVHYRDGDGVPKEIEKAREFFEQAANQGHREAGEALAALPPKPKPLQPLAVKDITILSAQFGLNRRQADVTTRVAEMLKQKPEGFVVNTGSMRADPFPGRRKRLNIKYEYKGGQYTFGIQGQKTLTYQALIKNAEK